jgi:hypothetical protein
LIDTHGDTPASQRDVEEVRAELEGLKDAHLENETARDAFLALAHTALFAASIAFVGDLAEHDRPRILWLLLLGWLASVIGLSALTLSFSVATRHIRRRHDQVYEAAVDEPRAANILNSIALWSFPIALISTFLFAAINMIDMSKDRPAPPPPAVPITRGVTPPPRAPTPQTGVVPAPRAPAPPPPPPAAAKQ